jgi:hypothetical protein
MAGLALDKTTLGEIARIKVTSRFDRYSPTANIGPSGAGGQSRSTWSRPHNELPPDHNEQGGGVSSTANS